MSEIIYHEEYLITPVFFKPRLSSDATELIAILISSEAGATVHSIKDDNPPVVQLIIDDLKSNGLKLWAPPVAGAYTAKPFSLTATNADSAHDAALAILT